MLFFDTSKPFRFEGCYPELGSHSNHSQGQWVWQTHHPPTTTIQMLFASPFTAHNLISVSWKVSHGNTRAQRKEHTTVIMWTTFPSPKQIRSHSGVDLFRLPVRAERHTQAEEPGGAQPSRGSCTSVGLIYSVDLPGLWSRNPARSVILTGTPLFFLSRDRKSVV